MLPPPAGAPVPLLLFQSLFFSESVCIATLDFHGSHIFHPECRVLSRKVESWTRVKCNVIQSLSVWEKDNLKKNRIFRYSSIGIIWDVRIVPTTFEYYTFIFDYSPTYEMYNKGGQSPGAPKCQYPKFFNEKSCTVQFLSRWHLQQQRSGGISDNSAQKYLVLWIIKLDKNCLLFVSHQECA